MVKEAARPPPLPINGTTGGPAKDPREAQWLSMVAEAPWSGGEWAVALRFDNPRATVLMRLLSGTLFTTFWVLNALNTLEDHQTAFKTFKDQ